MLSSAIGRPKYLVKAVLSALVGTVSVGLIAPGAARGADGPYPSHCDLLPSPPGRPQFDDRFGRSNLGSSYDVYDGPGAVRIVRAIAGQRGKSSHSGGLWYHAGTRGVEMANASKLAVDYLGRVYAPSLVVEHRFWGDRWTLEMKSTFHGFQDGTTGSQRSINLTVARAPTIERTKPLVQITRDIDNPGYPSQGTLKVSSTSSKRPPIEIDLDPSDTYYWRIQRNDNTVRVAFSQDGYHYCQTTPFPVDPQTDGREQALLINGEAFDPGASVEIDYITIRYPVGAKVQPTKRRFVLEERGTPKLPIAVRAESIAKAIEAGSDVDVEDAVVIGDLNLAGTKASFGSAAGIRTTPKGRLTCKGCIFRGRIIAPWQVFTNDVSLVNCTMERGVSFLGSQFLAKADFSGSRFLDVAVFNSASFAKDGADFSGVRFEDRTTRAWYRGTRFRGPTSFYGAAFYGGADFSTTYQRTYQGVDRYIPTQFDGNVTFSDISVGKETDLVFYKALFHKRVCFYIAPARRHPDVAEDAFSVLFLKQALVPSGDWGQELSFEGATFLSEQSLGRSSGSFPGLATDSGQSGLIFSTDAPGKPEERFGPSSWDTTTRITLRDATFGQLTVSDLDFKGLVDLRGAHFKGGSDSIRLFNVDFTNVLLDDWPSTKVVATRRTRDALVGMFDSADDPALARVVYFDLLATSTEYDRWLSDVAQGADRRPQTYRDYPTFWFAQGLLNVFYLTDYGTSMSKISLLGATIVLLLSAVLLALDRRGYLVRTDAPRKFSLRLADIPIIRAHERVLETSSPSSSQGRASISGRQMYLAVLFSLGNITKFGLVDSVRLRLTDETPKALATTLTVVAWLAWFLGYLWVGVAIYALTAIPALKRNNSIDGPPLRE